MLHMVRSHEADGIVSAGNTGAIAAGAVLLLGRIPGIDRPGLGAVLPVLNRCTLLMDVGGTVRCKPVNLLQFAQMGSIYMKLFRNVENPSVRLLSNGEEATKGDEVISAARALIEQTKLNFQGTPRARTSRRESRTSSSATASPATSSSNSERGSASLSRASSKKNINTICFRKSDASSCSPL